MSVSSRPSAEGRPVAPGPPAGPGRRPLWWRLGHLAARRHRAVLTVWAMLLAGSAVLIPGLLERAIAPAVRVEGSASLTGARLLEQGFPRLGGEQMMMIFASATLSDADEPYQRALHDALRAVSAQPQVGGTQLLPVVPGQDHRHAYAIVGVNGDQRARQAALPPLLGAAKEAASRASGGRVDVHLVGESALLAEAKHTDLADLRRAELLAVPLSLLVLLAGLASGGAALAVLAVAGTVTVTALGLLAAASLLGVPVNTFMLAVAATVGLALGLDYALLILVRYRQSRAAGHDRHQAAAVAVSTAGRTAAWCAVGVALTAAALLVVRTSMIRTMGAAVSVSALVAALAAVTLLPAVLVTADRRLLRRRRLRLPAFLSRRVRALLDRPARPSASTGRPPDGRRREDEHGWGRWARHLMRHPVAYTLACAGLLLAAAAPLAGVRLAFDLDRASIAGTDFGRGLTAMEGDGISSSVAVALPHPAGAPPVDTAALVTALKQDPRVSFCTSLDNGRDLTVVIVIIRTHIDDPASTAMAREITGRLVPASMPPDQRAFVTGPNVIFSDLMDETTSQLGTVIPLVLGCSLVFLLVTFRSVLLPLKAVLMNLLAVTAAFGLLTLATRHLPHLVGTHVNTLVPLLAFTLVFGLSIDYEIFLIHRIAEHYHAGGDNTAAVVHGLRHTARPITVAAAVMVATFAALLTAHRHHLVQLGLAVATAITLDATVIRLALVPALMRILGARNWWLPAPLARLLPTPRTTPPPPPH
ncbi:MMPL family transporter [Nonomuraea pusilla]|uniref:Putative drug exporter of the RND superfamily n=1 Tax=Nonomuraea pusilla TaxID=46177 RepID=A0A1H7Z6H0_9ACTN|nr:MMPL family transporter [Nonomuraea pusilla]SEM53067.1 putative drug exporter of the RND superfamily [Nonomuraea pusilla]